MELSQNLNKDYNIMENVLKVADKALETGLKILLPDFIEDDVIEIKDKFIQEGFIEGVKEIIEKLEDVGKSIIGIFTGEFETMEQVKRVIEKDGLLDGISDVLDKTLKKLVDNKKIDKNVYNVIKTGKKELLNNIEKGLEDLYQENQYNLEKLDSDCEEWKKQYQEKDYEGMEKTIKKIKKKLDNNKVVENTINKAREIENIQKYIQEKGSIDSLSAEEKELINKLK